MWNLDSNFCLFIKVLAEKKEITNISATSKSLQMSRRMVYYYLDKLNSILEENEIGCVRKKKHTGIYITDVQSTFIKQWLQKVNSETFILSTQERRQIILLLILVANQKIYLKDFSSLLGVSRNTILNDIQYVKRKIVNSEVPCKLKSNKQLGYYVELDELSRRRKIYQYLQEIDHKQSEYVFHFFMMLVLSKQQFIIVPNITEIVKNIEICIQDTRVILNKEISLIEVKLLARAMILFLIRSWSGHRIYLTSEDQQIIMDRLEFLAAKKMIKELEILLLRNIPEEEALFLGMLLLCTQKNSDIHYKSTPFEELVLITESLVSNFEKISGIYFNQKECLIENIQTHIKVTYYRKKFEIITPLVELSEILTKYETVYKLTKKTFAAIYKNQYLQKYFPEGLKDDEIVSIALFFEDAIEKEQSISPGNQIIIVSDFANVFNSLLHLQIRSLIPDVKIKGIYSTRDIVKEKLNADYCISTNRDYIHPTARTLFVNSVLTKEDKERIITICNQVSDFNKSRMVQVKQLIQEYNLSINTDEFLMKLEKIFRNESILLPKQNQMNLVNAWNVENVFRVRKISSLNEAIDIIAVPLLKQNFIQCSYIDHIRYELFVKNRTLFIYPKAILLHTDYRYGSYKPGISMVYLDKPLFLHDDPISEVKLVILLSTEEKMGHVPILFELDELMKAGFLSELGKGKTMEEAFYNCAMNADGKQLFSEKDYQ